MPGVLPETYQILVRADVANQERETNEANNIIFSQPTQLIVRNLVTNTPVSGTFIPTDRYDYFAVALASGESVKFQVDSPWRISTS